MAPHTPTAGVDIRAGTDVVTLINVFTPQPGRQLDFARAQIAEYERLAGQVEGSYGANLHLSFDGARACNYAQFASLALYDQWIRGPLFGPHLDVIRPLIVAPGPAMYRVASAHTFRTRVDGPLERREGLSLSSLAVPLAWLCVERVPGGVDDVAARWTEALAASAREHDALLAGAVHVGLREPLVAAYLVLAGPAPASAVVAALPTTPGGTRVEERAYRLAYQLAAD